ncbi:DUF4190 domain-containing protein [Alteribacillus sp. HJP-4]|uniref:DUF4190 domain-containing protein n=1 Tax=Alteribacillus sp. HJP-4 TaxID=2775394 RepID=UPI0035CCD415
MDEKDFEKENHPDDGEEEVITRDGYDREEEDYNLETAAEVAAPGLNRNSDADNPEREEEEQRATMDADINDESLGTGIGVTALILSICSLFFLPVIMGGAGIVLGIFAARKGAKTLGYSAAGLGAFSIIMIVLFGPFF